jgi:hypothetical protein
MRKIRRWKRWWRNRGAVDGDERHSHTSRPLRWSTKRADASIANWKDRPLFFAIAAQTRRILVERLAPGIA